MNLIFLGAPGVGKGTQAVRLVAHAGLVQVSTGDMLRDAVARETALGLSAKAFMDAGDLVPDEVVVGIVKDRLAQPDTAQGVIFDGFPRTVPQAEALAAAGVAIAAVLEFKVPNAEIVQRLLGRGRADDTLETIEERLRVYEAKTAPLVAYYADRGLLKVIDGLGSETEIFDRVLAALPSGS